MILDITYDNLFLVYETPIGGTGGSIDGYSFDGNYFDYVSGSTTSNESISIFIN
jgi:hypothetical protein